MRLVRAADEEQAGGHEQEYQSIAQMFHAAKIADFRQLQQIRHVYRQADTILVFARNEKVDPVVADLLLECIVKQFIACAFQHLGDDILVNISQVSGEFVGKRKMFGFSRYAGLG